MKILHLLDHSLPLHSGYTFRSRNIFQCQRGAGLDPVVLTSPKHEQSWQGQQGAGCERIYGVRYYRSGAVAAAWPPVAAELALLARSRRGLQTLARRERPAVVHAHSPVLNALPALAVGRRRRLPVVYEIRAFWEDAAVDHGSYAEGGAQYRLVRALESYACRKVDRVVTICEGLRSDLVARGIPEDKVRVVPNAVNVGEFNPVERDAALAAEWGLADAQVIGFLGSFYHYEGLDLLLEAFARLQRAVPATSAAPPRPLKLLLVGGGRMETALKQQARELGIAEQVIFTGRLPHEQMPAMYSLVDVLCFPRKSMRLTELVTPLKPLETMAMGKAMVASDVGGHRELIRDGETGLLFRADEVASLADALQRVLDAGELRRGLEERGRTWVEQHRTWQANGERYRVLYAELTGC